MPLANHPPRHPVIFPLLCALFGTAGPAAISASAPDYTIELTTIHSGFDGNTCWMLPMAGAIPGERPAIVVALQKLLMSESDVFFAVNCMWSDDLGRSWSGPVEQSTLGRRPAAGGMTVGITAPVLKWNPARRKLLAIGETSYYRGDKLDREGPQRPAYTVYDPERRQWRPWATLAIPAAEKFHAVNNGCCQRVDLPDGTILLPVYFKAAGITAYFTTVLHCSFDGERLTYLGHGDELTLPFDPSRIDKKLDFDRRQFLARQSGLFEPSLTLFKGSYFLTMRNVKEDYVAVGTDGWHFDRPRPWKFDDGGPLGSENTQSHWVSHDNGLYLVYTRRGAHNDHVFRHRAPLFIARVDPERLRLVRASERVLIPERGAALGGSVGVTDIGERETWVTTSESMQAPGTNFRDYAAVQKYGADNSVYAARIHWSP